MLRGVDSQRLALQQSLLRNHSQRPREHFPVRLHVDQPPRPRDRRVIRRRFLQPDPQKTPQRQRVRRPPRHPALRVQSLEIPHQQQPEVHPRSQTRPPHLLRLEPPAPLLHEAVRTRLFQQLIQSLIERMSCRSRQIARGHPDLFLSLPLFPCSHRHAAILQPLSLPHKLIRPEMCSSPHFHHGLLGSSLHSTNNSKRTLLAVTSRMPIQTLAGTE